MELKEFFRLTIESRSLFINKSAETFRKNLYLFVGIFMVMVISLVFFVLAGGESGTPSIELKSPFDNKIDLDGNIVFVYNVTDPVANISNCSLIFNGAINQTDLSINKGIIQYFSLESVSNGDYNWSINCTNTANDENDSEIRAVKVFIDTIVPTVILNGPANNSETSNGSVEFNYTVNDNGWIANCSLYTDINGTWQINQTNYFIQKNVSLYFIIDHIADDTTFKWNVVCYDFALNSNFDWGNNNLTFTINNTAPTSITIPNQQWYEDNIHTINLSDYFSDIDGDILTYSSTSPSNLSVSIDNETGVATLNPDLNWDGVRTIIFYAFDIMGQSATSNTVTLTVVEVEGEGGDNPPIVILDLPLDSFNDTDGFINFTCNASDDFGLRNISLYTNISGSWILNQTKEVTGLTNSSTFSLTNLNEGSYLWGCEAYDTANQSDWSENRSFDVSIRVE